MVEDIAVGPAGIQQLYAGFRPQVAHTVLTHQQWPEPVLVQHLSQGCGGFLVFKELAIAF